MENEKPKSVFTYLEQSCNLDFGFRERGDLKTKEGGREELEERRGRERKGGRKGCSFAPQFCEMESGVWIHPFVESLFM